jgi:protein TonB
MTLNRYYWTAGLLLTMLIHAWALAQLLPERLTSASAGGGNRIQIAFATLPGGLASPTLEMPQSEKVAAQPTTNHTVTNETISKEHNHQPTPKKAKIEKEPTEQLSVKSSNRKADHKAAPSKRPSKLKQTDRKPIQHNDSVNDMPVLASTSKQVKSKPNHQPMNDRMRETPAENQHSGTSSASPPGNSQTAATPGSAASGQGNLRHHRTNYEATLLTWLQKYKRYPKKALRKRIEGEGFIYFKIDRNGNILSQELRNSTGSPILDRAALAMLKSASPMPSVPNNLVGEAFEFTLPFSFNIKKL